MVKLSYEVGQMYGLVEMAQYLMMMQMQPKTSRLCSIYLDKTGDTEKWVIEIPNDKVRDALEFFGSGLGIVVPKELPKGEDVWDDDIDSCAYNSASSALLAYDILRKWVEITR